MITMLCACGDLAELPIGGMCLECHSDFERLLLPSAEQMEGERDLFGEDDPAEFFRMVDEL